MEKNSGCFYNNGQIAVSLAATSKAGYVYYPNGKVAIAISTASTYQNSYCAYDDDEKNSLLLALNEAAVGFAQTTNKRTKGPSTVSKKKVIFTKHGGIMTDKNDLISLEWSWKKKTSSHPEELKEEATVKLSEFMTLRFKSKEEISIDFLCESTNYSADMGVKVLREKANYLQTAKRLPGGHLLPELERLTLKHRTIKFNESMRMRRNRLNPRAENLSEMVSGVVSDLEGTFDELTNRMHCKISLGSEWRDKSLSVTKTELPHIPLCGTETGEKRGLGDSIYVDTDTMQQFDAGVTSPKHLTTNKGMWKSDSGIRDVLLAANPIMRRTFLLKSASGRYSNMIIVNPANVTPQNPTGMVKTRGKSLESMTWNDFRSLIKSAPICTLPDSPFIVGLIMRNGLPDCCIAKGISEIVNLELNGGKSCNNCDVKMVKIDVSNDSRILKELGVKSLPMFVMIHSGRLVYAGQIGGRHVHLKKRGRAQVLLIEPIFQNQVETEKALRKSSCDTFLCLDVKQALERLQQVNQMDNPMEFDLILISEDVKGGDLDTLYRKLSTQIKAKRTVVAALVNVLGDCGKMALNSVIWNHCTSLEIDKIISNDNPICKFAQIVVQKPVKVSSIQKVLEMRTVTSDDASFGLTPESLINKINEVQENLKLGQIPLTDVVMQKIGIKLSAEDIKFRGTRLVKSSLM